MVRMQLYLDDDVHATLRDLARRQGRTLSDLVREALKRAYGTGGAALRARTLKAIEGLWRDHDEAAETDAYVRRLRRATRRSLDRRD